MMARILLLTTTTAAILGLCQIQPVLGSDRTQGCDIIIEVALDEVLIEDASFGRGTIITWNWGTLILESEPLVPLDDDSSFGWSVSGEMRTFGPRDEEGLAPLTFLASGMTLVVDGNTAITSVDGATVLSEHRDATNPLASFALLIAILILTALMMRTTRRNLARR